MVFLKCNKDWISKQYTVKNRQLLRESIDSLIDQVRDARAHVFPSFLVYPKREQINKEIHTKGKERRRLIDWGDRFQPRSFIHLLSDGFTNRVFMKWLTQWKPLLFHVVSFFRFHLVCTQCEHC